MSFLLLIGGIGGFFTHRLKTYIDTFPRGWREMISYTVGVTLVFPLFLVMHKEGEGHRHNHVVAFWLSFTSFGLGVAASYLFDTVSNE